MQSTYLELQNRLSSPCISAVNSSITKQMVQPDSLSRTWSSPKHISHTCIYYNI